MNTDGLDLMGESLRIEPVRKYADLTGLIQLLGDDPIFDGNYSKVYQATVRGRMVAVKVLKHIAGKNDEAMERKMTREMNYWAETKSQFIADFLGHALDQQFGPLGAFISPWYSNGDSYMYLQSQKEELTFWDRIDLLYSVANGLVSLHNKGIVHGDLKPSNVLIDSDGNPKICDFGLARLLPDVPSQGLTTTSEYTGTPRFLAPELLTSDSMPPTTASDVWAFGCLALEYIFQTMPYAHRLNNHRGMIYQDIKGGRLPCEKTARQGLDDAVQELLHICWHRNHITRPRAKDVRQLVCLLRGSDYPFLCKIGNHGEPGIEAFDIAYAKRTMASKEPSVHVFLRPSSQTLIPFADNIYVRSDWRQWSIFRVLDTLVDEGSQWSVREIHTGRISNLSNPAEARIATIFNLLEEYEAMRKKGGSPFPILPVREWPIHDQGSIFLSMLPPVERGFAQTVLNYLMP